jgi:hypothetical protein
VSITFQQDLENPLKKLGHPAEQAHSLSLRCCASFCYYKACKKIGVKLPKIENFIYEVYQEGRPGSHELGINHTEMAKYIHQIDSSCSAISLDPLRTHCRPRRFKKIGSFTGKRSYKFFRSNYRKLNKNPTVTNSVKLILKEGGIPIVGAIQTLTNGYIGSASKEGETPTHNFIIHEYIKGKDSFLMFDPDKRAYEDKLKLRPKEIKPVPKKPGFYYIKSDFLENNSHKTYNAGRPNQRLGGIVIGIFKD